MFKKISNTLGVENVSATKLDGRVGSELARETDVAKVVFVRTSVVPGLASRLKAG